MAASAAHQRAVAKYNAANMVQLKINLNQKTDADVIKYLETVESKAGYIKSLIRADMEKRPQ